MFPIKGIQQRAKRSRDGCCQIRAIGCKKNDRRCACVARKIMEQAQAGFVCGMQIVYKQKHWGFRCQVDKECGGRVEERPLISLHIARTIFEVEDWIFAERASLFDKEVIERLDEWLIG